jgi:TPP-dependent pyruvate/acetoin dehydrogenase alpha subunit
MAWDEVPVSDGDGRWFEQCDGVLRFIRESLDAGELARSDVIEIDDAIRQRVQQAVAFALTSPPPAVESAAEGVFAAAVNEPIP